MRVQKYIFLNTGFTNTAARARIIHKYDNRRETQNDDEKVAEDLHVLYLEEGKVFVEVDLTGDDRFSFRSG